MALRKRTLEHNFLPQPELTLVRGGKEYFHRVQELIATAQHTIHLQMYIFSYDATGRMVIDWLLRSAEKGVHIFLLVDGYATRLPETLIRSCAAANLNIKYYAPLFKNRNFYFGRRLHHKLLVVDGRRAMVGSCNINDHYYGSPDHTAWMDMALYLEGPAAVGLQSICVQMWNRESGREKPAIAISPTSLYKECGKGGVSVKICRNDWADNLQQITRSYINMLSKARNHVYLVSSYFLPGRSLRRQMKAAVKRGVKVTVVTAGISDVTIAKRAERYLYYWLLHNHIEVYEYRDSILHAKLGIRDGRWLTLGSFNINNISTYASIELNLEVRNKPFVQGVQQELKTIISNSCTRISEEGFRDGQTLFVRILQRFSYDIIRIVLYLFTFYFKRQTVDNKFF